MFKHSRPFRSAQTITSALSRLLMELKDFFVESNVSAPEHAAEINGIILSLIKLVTS